MKYKLILLTVLLFFFNACSKDDNPVAPDTDSFITGTWEARGFTTFNNNIDSVAIDLQLSGKDGSFTGSGTVVLGGINNGNAYIGYFNDDIIGTYSENSISMSSKNKVTNDTFNFNGNKVDGTFGGWSFKGTAIYVISGTSHTYDINFYKNN